MSLQTGELCRKGLTKVKDLKINGCEELTSSLKNEARLLQQLTILGVMEIEDNSPLVEELGREVEELLQLQILECKLECLELNKCKSLLKLPKGLNQLSSLQELHIHECPRLVSFPDVGLPHSLKDIVRSLSLRGQLLKTFKHLEICYCEQLELIASDGFFSGNTNQCLECIRMRECQNLKSLPDGLCHLSNLQTLNIDFCGNPVSIPRLSGGRKAANLRNMLITDCDKLEALPQGMHNLNSLKELDIDYYEGLTCSFPPNLTSLYIWKVKSCKPLWELVSGLRRLTSLRYLCISGEDPDTVSFPPDMVRMETLLPKSLAELRIDGFPDLKKLSSKGFQFLTSLQSLELWDCPKLASLPKEGLPPSLRQLRICGCPVLKERCQPGKGHYWHKISHIPYIEINLVRNSRWR